MKENLIRKFIKIVEESNISELEISRWGRKVRISKNYSGNHKLSATQPVENIVVSHNEALKPVEKEVPEVKVSETPVEATQISAEQANGHVIRSPMVGTFYRKPSPESDSYVEKGDQIMPGKVLCIIEAMKLMNEIEAEISGTIIEILVEDGNPVEYNQPLFKVKAE